MAFFVVHNLDIGLPIRFFRRLIEVFVSRIDPLVSERKGDDGSMKIKTLWQKTCEDVIELSVAVDEYVDEVNPDHWTEQCSRARMAYPDCEERIITFDIPDSVIWDAFKPIHIRGVRKVGV